MAKKQTKKKAAKVARKKTASPKQKSNPPAKPATPAERKSFEQPAPVLRFAPDAWAKLQWFCHRGDTEIGGFAVTDPDDLLLIRRFVTVKQTVSITFVSFDDEAVADYFEDQVQAGVHPEQCGRIWLHTHPGSNPEPSATDENTFTRVFGGCHWAVMFILARDGSTYARLRFGVGPGGEMVVPVEIDWQQPFAGSDHEAWEAEYQANIEIEQPPASIGGEVGSTFDDLPPDLGPLQRQEAMEILAADRGLDLDDIEDENEVIL
jgi:hypothetical protein